MNVAKYQSEIEDLLKRGKNLEYAMLSEQVGDKLVSSLESQGLNQDQIKKFRAKLPHFSSEYQTWYSEALAVIKQLMPDRAEDFIDYYRVPKNRKQIDYASYKVSDYLQGTTLTRGYQKEKVVGPDAAIGMFQQQLGIVAALQKRFTSSLFDVRALVQADLFDDELAAASSLLKNGFERPSGALVGVILEGHLKEICRRHSIVLGRKKATLADYNDALKDHDVLDTTQWRNIQYLTDIRNLCDHKGERDPKNFEVQDLIDGTAKVIKTIF